MPPHTEIHYPETSPKASGQKDKRMGTASEKSRKWSQLITGATGIGVACVAILVLSGWIFDFSLLKYLFPTWTNIAPATAVCLLLAGFALTCLRLANFEVGQNASEQSTCRFAAAAFGAAVVLIAAFHIAGQFAGRYVLIDFAFIHKTANAARLPSMAPSTSTAFFLAGAALALATTRRFSRLFQTLAVAVFLIGWIEICNVVYGGQSLSRYTRMPSQTACCFCIVGLGILCSRRDYGLMQLMCHESAGGVIMRRLLPAVLLVPLAMNWLELQMERWRVFPPESDQMIFTLVDVLIFGAVMWGTAATLHRKDLEQKQIKESLNESQELLHAIVESSEDAIISKNLQGFITSWNEGAQKLFGYAAEDAIGKSMRMLIPKDRANEEDEILHRIKSGKKIEHIETVRIHKDGRALHISATISPIRDEQNKVIGASQIARDITNRKQAELALTESEARLRLVTENVRVGLVIINSNREYTYANSTYSEILGLGSESLIGKRVADLPTAVYEEQVKPRLDDAFSGKSVRYELQYRLGHKEHIYVVSYEPMKTDKAVSMIVAVISDITERRNLEAQFRQSQKMESVGQLAGGVAHDFNNLLAVIGGHCALIGMRGKLDNQLEESVGEIEKACERAASLTQQLLAFSRRQTLLPKLLDLNSVVINTTKMLQRILGADIQIEFKFSPAALTVQADAGMMDQILLNFAVNSRDAMPKGGRLIIETSAVAIDPSTAAQQINARSGSFACLSVTDTGCGIPKEILPKIFEPFFTTKEAGKGTGLGLATVFGIVEQHNGWVNAYSETGRGTTFRVYLPLVAQAAEKQSATPAVHLPGGTETILVAEDDPALRLLIREFLTKLGYRILETASGKAALEVWRNERKEIQLLLTDMVMPDELSGFDLVKKIHAEHPQLPVIFISGYSPEIAGKEIKLEEGTNFLGKPFSLQKLAQTIRQSLDRRR